MRFGFAGCVLMVLGVMAAGAASAVDFPGPAPGKANARVASATARLENKAIAVEWSIDQSNIRLKYITDKLAARKVDAAGAAIFSIRLGESEVLRSSDMRVTQPLRVEKTAKPGKALTATLASSDGSVTAHWRAVLLDSSNHIRTELSIETTQSAAPVREITLLDIPAEGRTVGTVPGSPVCIGNVFAAVEHPMSANTASDGRVRCGIARNGSLKSGGTVTASAVIGVATEGQLRRSFLYYLEGERAHPYRPFLHYNSWYDLPWDRRINEKDCLAVIDGLGTELVARRDVKLDAIVWDDGWDDRHSLWQIDKAYFPHGFEPLKERASKYQTHIGAWVSPWGGYGGPHDERVRYGKEQGFETTPAGLSLAGPIYYKRFSEVCTNMIRSYGANYFKFDGTDAGQTEQTEALLRLTSDLRKLSPDLFVNMTVGTWPSPFWLKWGDSTWRGGADTAMSGEGSERERWINYKDATTYSEVVSRAPLYPLNSLMIHGIAYGHNGAEALAENSNDSLAHEIWAYFGSGTGLQELYISFDKMKPADWDTLAEAAKWSRANADVLIDTHWVGGDPSKGEVYGWAAWSKRKGILTLRCPSSKPRSISVDVARFFELPAGAPKDYVLKSPRKCDASLPALKLSAGVPQEITLQPFEVRVYEAVPEK